MGIHKTFITLASILWFMSACEDNRHTTTRATSGPQLMDNQQNLTLKPGETFQVILQSRGAAGLQLLYRCEDDSIVRIQRKESFPSDSPKDWTTNIGGSMPAVFAIQALKEGETKVTFYETRPWDKNFKEIIQKQLTIVVAGRAP